MSAVDSDNTETFLRDDLHHVTDFLFSSPLRLKPAILMSVNTSRLGTQKDKIILFELNTEIAHSIA